MKTRSARCSQHPANFSNSRTMYHCIRYLLMASFTFPAFGSPYTHIKKPDAPLPEGALFRIGTVSYLDGAILNTKFVIKPDWTSILIKNNRTWERWDLNTGERINDVFPDKLRNYGEKSELRKVLLPYSKYPESMEHHLEHSTIVPMQYSRNGRHLYAKLYPWDQIDFVELDMVNKRLVHVYGLTSKGYNNPDKRLNWSADGRNAVGVSGVSGVSGVEDFAKIQVWDLEKKVELWSADVEKGRYPFATASSFSPDGTFLITGGHRYSFDLRDTSDGRIIWDSRKSLEHGSQPISFHPKGHQFLISNRDASGLTLWETKTGNILKHLKAPSNNDAVEGPVIHEIADLAFEHPKAPINARAVNVPVKKQPSYEMCNGVTFSPDGRHALSFYEEGSFRIWNMLTGEVKKEFTGHERSVHDAFFSPDGKRFISIAADSTALMWDFQAILEE